MNLIIFTSLLLILSCQTIKPYEFVYSYDKDKKLFCSWKALDQKEEICKSIEEIDTDKFRLFNEDALEKKFNDVFKRFNKCLSTKQSNL